MRRKTRRYFANLVFFGTALSLIIYLNRHQSNNKTFAWTTIRYKTTSNTLPEARGTCPGLANTSKPALVVSRVAADGDPKWLDQLTNLYHLCIYTVDTLPSPPPTTLQVPANRGHEAMAYLTFLIDNYADIPTAGAVFVHGSRKAWHNDAPDYDNAALLAALNVSAALAPSGYHNLRCDWSASMCERSYAPPQGSLEVSLSAMLEPWNARAVSDAALPGALAVLFGGERVLGRTDAVRAQCCAQFVVARERVWRHSRDEYVALRQWLLDGSSDGRAEEQVRMGNVAPSDDRVAGRILSYLWHILFLQPEQDSSPGVQEGVGLDWLDNMACPRADDCYCRLYGRCNLPDCRTPGHCQGQYVLPPDFRLPDDLTATPM